MGLIFRCPTTGHKFETALEIADEKLLLSRKVDLQTSCWFCGRSYERGWIAKNVGEPKVISEETGLS